MPSARELRRNQSEWIFRHSHAHSFSEMATYIRSSKWLVNISASGRNLSRCAHQVSATRVFRPLDVSATSRE
jgi:hypothetical protein